MSSSKEKSSTPTGKFKVGVDLHYSADSEVSSMPEQSWSNVSGRSFDTRIGPGYATHKKKEQSKPCIYQCAAIDIFTTEGKVSHVGRFVDLPGDHVDDSANNGYLPQTFIVNFQIPNYPVENALWGQCAGDGPGYSIVFYFVLSEYGKEQVAKRGKLESAADAMESELYGTLSSKCTSPRHTPVATPSAMAGLASMFSLSSSSSSSAQRHHSASTSSNSNAAESPSAASSAAAAAAAAASSAAAAHPHPHHHHHHQQSQTATSSSSSAPSTTPSSASSSAPYYYSPVDPYCFRSPSEPCNSAVRLLHHFVAADDGTELRQRFKAICRMMNVDSVGLGSTSKKLVQMYNATPFLIRTCSVFWRGERYFEVDCDVHRFSYTARLGLSGVKERIKDVVFDFGFVIEGHSDFELPENMLGAVRISKLDLSRAKPFPA